MKVPVGLTIALSAGKAKREEEQSGILGRAIDAYRQVCKYEALTWLSEDVRDTLVPKLSEEEMKVYYEATTEINEEIDFWLDKEKKKREVKA